MAVTTWVRPAHMDKHVMFAFYSDDAIEADAWNRAMQKVLRDRGGFQQISVPNPPCVNFRECMIHWTCPGWYAWEIWSGSMDEEVLFNLFLDVRKEARRRLQDLGWDLDHQDKDAFPSPRVA